MSIMQVFWDNYPRKPGWEYPEDYGKSGSRMYREDDFVIFEYLDFDGEDQREYEYTGKFSVEDYKKALDQLQKTGRAELTEPRGTLIMNLKDNTVHLTFLGTPSPCTTPGGARLSGSVPSSCEIKKMVLTDP